VSGGAADPPPEGVPPLPEDGVLAWLPGLWVLRHYRRAWLAHDLSAGLVLSALLVPAGMGYAQASGLPAVTGLYATVGGLVAYALFGPSRILVIGPDSALTALVAAAVVVPAAGDAARATGLAALLALLTGVLCVVAGLARAGFVTELLSKPVRVGYLHGIALTVVVSQMPRLFGFSVSAPDVPGALAGFAHGLLDGRMRPLALALGVGSLAVVLGFRRFAPRVPGVLVAVAGATAAVWVGGLEAQVPVVGALPPGLPLPALPSASLEELSALATAATGIALVSFADTSVLSRAFAARTGHRVDANRELVGLGLANLAAGLVQGFPVSGSASRTPVAVSAGARTQLTGLVGAAVIVALLVAGPGLVRAVPASALAAVVLAAALGIFDLAAFRTFLRVRRSDFVLALAAFVAVAALGVLRGVAVAVALSLLDVVRRVWRPHDAVLGRVPGVKGYHDVTRHPEARQVPGLLLFRWDAPLFFANADTFRARVLACVAAAPEPVRWVVVAAEPITDVDTTAAEALEELDAELTARGVELAFAELKGPVKDRLRRYGLAERIGRAFFFPTLGVAVKTYVERHDVAWADPDEPPPAP
jgi:high affinity sulfate transporter 1